MKDKKLNELIKAGEALLALLYDEDPGYHEWITKTHDAKNRWKKAVLSVKRDNEKANR